MLNPETAWKAECQRASDGGYRNRNLARRAMNPTSWMATAQITIRTVMLVMFVNTVVPMVSRMTRRWLSEIL